MVPLTGQAFVEPVSPAVMSRDKTRPASPLRPISILVTNPGGEAEQILDTVDPDANGDNKESSRGASDSDDSETRGSQLSRLQLDELTPSEATESTLLRTLELSAQTRTQKVKIKTKGRGSKADLTDLHLVQQLTCPAGTAIFALAFSPDGVYLAAACADSMVRVWVAISEQLPVEEEQVDTRTAALFTCEPIQCFTGHEGEVLDISWSSVLNE